MSSKWFANRGQVLQILIAFAALVIGIFVAFPHLPVQQGLEGLTSVAPIIVFPMGALVLMWLNNIRINRTLEKIGLHVTDVSLPPATPKPDAPAPPPSLAKLPTPTEPRWETDEIYVVDQKIKIGSYWDEPNSGRISKIRISVLGLKGDDPGRQSVELQCSSGGALFHGGSETKGVGTNRFIVPQSSSGFQAEERCVQQFSFSEELIFFLVIRLDAIDTHANEVTLNIAKIRAAKRTSLR